MVKNNVWSIIILFNPDIERLQSLVHHLMLQNSKIILVNNGSKNCFISDLINEYVFLIQLEDNFGIAKAQNVGITFAKKKKAKGIFLFDQDSKISNNFIPTMLNAKIASSVGMIVPNVLDVNTNKYLEPRIYNRQNSKITVEFPKNKTTEEVIRKAAKPIASGSYIFMDALMQVGGMREKFFIDAVDTDFSFRLIEKGYDVFRINNVHLVHPVGNKIERNFFGKKIFLSNHSPKRRYYIGRNNIWLWKIHFGKINGITKDVFVTLFSQLVYSLLEKSSVSKTSHLIWGILEGLISSPKEIVREIK
ncbi:rhamnosyltransferase [Leuconostoc mesenteroides subsp. dextranicum]|uniref:glycosyltransferase family 2 protein n=1 Tax=Leuconostoc mesenteroides TaxID=1245 RepID=UPI0024A05E76|nr:glycosyltransferase family 2 protein [Leuconostoc mesenteroides]GLX32761.1 rhamnosyltransferase [Leuconostoc mesenteroides subsp. dextranicum]